MISDDPARRPLDLTFFGYAADDECCLGHALGAQVLVLFVDLHGELARGQQDQSAGALRGLAAQHFDHGDQKCEGLAGSGLSRADYVLPVEGGLDGALLDRG